MVLVTFLRRKKGLVEPTMAEYAICQIMFKHEMSQISGLVDYHKSEWRRVESWREPEESITRSPAAMESVEKEGSCLKFETGGV